MNRRQPLEELPVVSPSLVLIGACLIAWMSVTPEKKRARIVRIIDAVLDVHGVEANVVVLRGVGQAPEVRKSFAQARAWWAGVRPIIETKAKEYAGL